MHDLSTTLVAVATAPGRGGVGCVRLSGPEAREIARALFVPGRESRTPQFGSFLDDGGRRIDHGFLVEFDPDRSFTGEPTAELWAHGSPPVLASLVDAALRRGAVAATAGEFTYRALRNGKLDLARAEAIRDLIAARSLHQARVAFLQVEGAAARRLAPLRSVLLDLAARAEASVEFVDEPDVGDAGLAEGSRHALSLARDLLDEARRGRVVREGARVAICGAVSVGKSSLFNRLLGHDRAIVSESPGTTRDTLEEGLDLDGVVVTLVDTAGLRSVSDHVEAEGVRRARAAAAEADLSLLVLEAGREPAPEELAGSGDRPTLVVLNKIDLLPPGAPPSLPGAVPISVRTGAGLEELRRALRERLTEVDGGDLPALTDVRHAMLLERVVAALERASDAARAGLSEEAVLLDVRDASSALGEVSGNAGTEELYDKIFSTFCIGK